MSSIKIPELDLYTKKRRGRGRVDQNQQVRGFRSRVGMHQGLLASVKGQVYLQKYKNNLKHFVSPCKYRDKAQNFIRTGNKQQSIVLRAMAFPTSRPQCVNCYTRMTQENRRCQCERPPLMPSVKRVRSQEKPLFSPRNIVKPVERKQWRKQMEREIRQVHQITIQGQNHQEQNNYHHQTRLRTESNESQQRYISEMQNSITERLSNQFSFGNMGSNLNIEQSESRNQERMIDRLQFREEIANHRNRLENIHISPNDSKTTEIDISPLVQAKKQYVTKSKQIIRSLDQILLKYN